MSKLVNTLAALIENMAVAVLPQAPAVIAAGKALIAFVGELSPTLSESDQAALQARLPDLIAAMNQAVDQAVKDLGADSQPG